MGSPEIGYISALLMLFAALVGGWGISLIIRAGARRIERIRARQLEEAGKPVPPHLRTQAVLALRSAVVIGTLCVLAGCASVFAGLSIEWWTGLEPLSNLVDNWWGVGAAGWVVAAIVVIATGAWFDRSKGRPRCPACWYDVESMLKEGEGRTFAQVQCPECGRKIRRARELYRTRRHVLLIRLGLFMLLCAYLTLAMPRTMEFGATGLMPTTAMIACMSYLPDSMLMERDLQQRWVSGTPTRDSLLGRIDDSHTWHWQRVWFHERVAEAWAHPRRMRDLEIAMVTRWANRSYRVTGLQANAVLDGLLSSDATDQEIATEMLSGGVYRGEAGNEIVQSLAGRTDDILRAATTRHGDRIAWQLLVFAGNEPIKLWEKTEPAFEATAWSTDPIKHQEVLITLASLARRSEKVAAYIDRGMGQMQARRYDAAVEILRAHGPHELLQSIDARALLASRVLDAKTSLELRVECARQLGKLGRSPHSERAVRALRSEDSVKQNAAFTAELQAVYEEVRVLP